MAAELTPGGVDTACHPSEVSEMSTSALVEGHSISGTAMFPRNDSYPAAKLPYARPEPLRDGARKDMYYSMIFQKFMDQL